jgi:hypothetical protein
MYTGNRQPGEEELNPSLPLLYSDTGSFTGTVNPPFCGNGVAVPAFLVYGVNPSLRFFSARASAARFRIFSWTG